MRRIALREPSAGPRPGGERARPLAGLTVAIAVLALAAPGEALHAAPPATGAQPGLGPAIVAGPGSTPTTFYTLIAVATAGGDLTFVNLDYEAHDVLSVATGPDDQPWCHAFLPGQCPLLWSALIGTAEITPVLGTEHLEAGEIYEFYCGPHPGMRGLLFVAENP